jgi:hypothetical protein
MKFSDEFNQKISIYQKCKFIAFQLPEDFITIAGRIDDIQLGTLISIPITLTDTFVTINQYNKYFSTKSFIPRESTNKFWVFNIFFW